MARVRNGWNLQAKQSMIAKRKKVKKLPRYLISTAKSMLAIRLVKKFACTARATAWPRT